MPSPPTLCGPFSSRTTETCPPLQKRRAQDPARALGARMDALPAPDPIDEVETAPRAPIAPSGKILENGSAPGQPARPKMP
jgi:hypothetical protein